MKCMGALITSGADPLSAMRHKMCQADRVMRMNMAFYQNKGLFEKMKHTRHSVVVQSCLFTFKRELELDKGVSGRRSWVVTRVVTRECRGYRSAES